MRLMPDSIRQSSRISYDPGCDLEHRRNAAMIEPIKLYADKNVTVTIDLIRFGLTCVPVRAIASFSLQLDTKPQTSEAWRVFLFILAILFCFVGLFALGAGLSGVGTYGRTINPEPITVGVVVIAFGVLLLFGSRQRKPMHGLSIVASSGERRTVCTEDPPCCRSSSPRSSKRSCSRGEWYGSPKIRPVQTILRLPSDRQGSQRGRRYGNVLWPISVSDRGSA
jgi:hypothetical protein